MSHIALSAVPLLPLVLALLTARVKSAFSPLVLVLAVMIFGTVLKGSYLALSYAEGRVDYGTMRALVPGALAMLVGNTAFVLGYFAVSGKMLRRQAMLRRIKAPFWLSAIVFWAFAARALVLELSYLSRMGILENMARGQLSGAKVFITESGVQAGLGYLSVGAEFGLVIFVMALAHGGNRWAEKAFFGALLIGAVAVFFFSSQRLSIGYAVVFILLSMRAGRFGGLARISVVAGSVLLLLGATIVRRIGQIGEGMSFRDAAMALLDNVFARPYFLTIDKTGLIVERVTEGGLYMFGESISSILFAPIPRELWPDKPDLRVGPHVADVIFGSDSRSGIPPGLIGEFFLNFGWIGIVGGMFAFGVVARLAFNRFQRYRGSQPDERVLYGIFAVSFLLVALVTDVNGGLLRYAKLFIAFLVSARYFSQRTARREIRRAPRAQRRAVVIAEVGRQPG